MTKPSERAVLHANRMWRVWRPDGKDMGPGRAGLAVHMLAGTGGDTLVFPDGLMVRIEPVEPQGGPTP